MQKLLLLTSALLLARLDEEQLHYPPLYTYISPPPGMDYTSSAMGKSSARMRGNYTEPWFRIGVGSYQTPDGTWHSAKAMVFNGVKLIVKDEGQEATYTATTLRQFEVVRDTFLVFSNLPGQSQNAHPKFLESAFYRHGTRVLRWSSGPNMKPHFFLQRPQLPMMSVANRKEDFKKTMLAIVGGCPALVASITDGRLGPEDVPVIMQQYDVCQFGTSATDKSK